MRRTHHATSMEERKNLPISLRSPQFAETRRLARRRDRVSHLRGRSLRQESRTVEETSKKKRPTTAAHDPAVLPPLNPPSSNISSSSIGLISKLANPPTQIANENVEIPDTNRVLVAVLKIFFVVVLALGTKSFVVGITMSAFFLFLLEFVGMCVFRLLEPCSDAQKVFELMTQRVLRLIGIKQNKLEGEINSSKCSGLIEGNFLNAPTAEIIIIQTKVNLVPPVEQNGSVNENLNTIGCNKRFGFEEIDTKKEVMEKEDVYRGEGSELKTRHSRRAKIRAKMKSKMKKLVPNKLRKLSDSKSEVDGSMEEDKCEEQEHDKDMELCELESKSKSSILSSGSYDGEEGSVNVIFSSGELSMGDSEETLVTEGVGRETERNSGYWVLCLIVLAGLVGGRILALLLTICWCLMLESGGILRRYIKVSVVRSSVEICN